MNWKTYAPEPVGAAARRRELLKALGCLGLVVLVIAALPVACSIGNGINYSDGTRTAALIKVSKKGVLWKTWEGELAIFTTEKGGAMKPYEFSIPDEALARSLATHEGKTVRISYDERLCGLPWLGSTSVYVTGFEVVERP